MKADCGAVWIPFHTCSNQTEVAEAVLSFVMTLKELDESISSGLESCRNRIDNAVLHHTICDLYGTVLIYTNVVMPSEEQAAAPCPCAIFLCWTWTLALASIND